jgi:anti-sigma factor RsiW
MNALPISEDDLMAYVDGALPPSRRAEVETYLAAHPKVARRITGYATQGDALRAAYGPVANEPVPSRLNLTHLTSARRPAPALWQAMAACALVILGVAGGWFAHGAAPKNGIMSLAREGVASFAVYAPDVSRPVEIKASDSRELVDWASQRLKRHVTVPDLTASGFTLMGGRLVVTPHGPAVMMMYTDATGARLALVSRPMAIDKNQRMKAHSEDGVAGYVWSDDGMGYDLVGRAGSETLHPLADEARRQILGRA